MFCITVLNGYHLSHPDDHAPSHGNSLTGVHHASSAHHDRLGQDGDDQDLASQFTSHSALHAISLADPVILVFGSATVFASWYPAIGSIVRSIDPPEHLRPPRS